MQKVDLRNLLKYLKESNMKKTFDSAWVGVAIVSVLLCGLALSIDKLQKQREEDRKIINGLGMAIIQLIQEENNQTY